MPVKRQSWARRLLLASGLLLGLGLAGVVIGGIWLGSASGLSFLLDRAQRSVAQAGGSFMTVGAKGGLYRGVTFDRVEWSDGKTTVVAANIAARWSLRSVLRRELVIPFVQIASVTVNLPAGQNKSDVPAADVPMPGDLGLPVSFDLNRFRLKRLLIVPASDPSQSGGAREPIEITDLQFKLNYQDGAYNVLNLSATSEWGRISKSRVSLNDAMPHAVVLRANFAGAIDSHATNIKAAALGNLNGLNVSLKGDFSKSPVSLNVRLRPLKPNLVVSANGWVRKFDLARISPGLPHSSLDVDLNLLNPRALPQVEEKTAAEKEQDEAAFVPQGAVTTDPEQADAKAAASLEAWRGTVELSNANSGPLGKGLVPVRTAAAEVRLDATGESVPTKLTLSKLRIGVPGAKEEGAVLGTVQALLNERHAIAGFELPVVVAGLQFRNIDLAHFAKGAAPTALNGSLDLTRDLFVLDLAQSEGPLRQAVTLPGGGRASVSARGRISNNALNLDSATIQLNKSRVSVSGRTTLAEPFEVAVGGRIEQVDLESWLLATSGLPAQWREGRITGDWSLNGTVAPHFDANLSVNLGDSRIGGHPLGGNLAGRLSLTDKGVPERIQDTRLKLSLGANSLSINGSLGKPEDVLKASGRFGSPELFEPRLTGKLGFDGRLTGTFNALLASIVVNGSKVSWQQQENAVTADSFKLQADMPIVSSIAPQTMVKLKAEASGVALPGQLVDKVRLDVDGTVAAHRFNLSGAGQGQSVRVAGSGSLVTANTPTSDAPPRWQAKLVTLNTDGSVLARLRSPAQIAVDAQSALVTDLALTIVQGRLDLSRASVNWGDAQAFAATGVMTQLPVTRIARVGGVKDLPPELDGLRIDSTFSLTGSGPADLNGDLKLTLTEAVNRKSATKGGAGRAGIGLAGKNQASIQFTDGQMDGSVDMSLPTLVFSRRFTGPDWAVDGSVGFAGNLSGTLNRPRWNGRLTARELSLRQPALGWRFENGALIARFEGRRIVLDKLRLDSGEGSISLTGAANLLDEPRNEAQRNGTLPLDGRFELVADKSVVPIGPGQRLVLSGKSELTSDASGLKWQGNLSADEGYIEIAGSGAPNLPDDVQIIDTQQPAKSGEDGGAGDGASDSPQVQTSLDIDLGKKLRVTGGGVDAILTGKLKLQGSLPGEPRIVGTVNIENGSYFAYGQQLVIERGAVRFNGPVDNPLLDITANRPNLPLTVGVNLGGTALTPRIELVSSPSLPDAEKLSWLVLGTGLDNAQAGAQTLALKQAAAALIGNDDGSISGGGFADKLGLDTLGLGYASETGQQDGVSDAGQPTGLPGSSNAGSLQARQEVVTLGKKLSKRLSVSYEQGVRGIWNLLRIQYEISNRLSVRAQTGSENAVDLIYFYSFD